VVPKGDRRRALVALRDRLAQETDDTLWAKHKRECNCQCGMGDGRLLVALVKELRDTLRELDSLPDEGRESAVDKLTSRVSATRDELSEKRTTRRRSAAPAS
jgi:hypothetical protein